MAKNFKIGDRIKCTEQKDNYMTGTIFDVIPENEIFAGMYRVHMDVGGNGIVPDYEMELLPPVKFSEVSGKVDEAIWLNKVIASDEAFKSKPGYALAAVVKVLLAKGVLTPSDFDLLTLEESAVTPVPANKD